MFIKVLDPLQILTLLLDKYFIASAKADGEVSVHVDPVKHFGKLYYHCYFNFCPDYLLFGIDSALFFIYQRPAFDTIIIYYTMNNFFIDFTLPFTLWIYQICRRENIMKMNSLTTNYIR